MPENINIVVLDGYTSNPGDLSWEGLEALGKLCVYDLTPPEQLLERCQDAEILVTNKTFLSAETIAALPKLKGVFLLSTGANAVDGAACAERGIPLCNVPAYSTASVVEMQFALLLGWARRAELHAGSVRQGDWKGETGFCYSLTPQVELAGKTLGVMGFGAIGQGVVRVALAFGMRVLVSTRTREGKPELGQEWVEEEQLLAESDVLSLCCPLTPATEGWLNRERLAQMKPGALMINSGRGALMDEQAVAEALASGQLQAALLDVLSSEPPEADNPLVPMKEAMITPHIAWATREARGRLLADVANNIQSFLSGSPRNVVNGL